MNGILAGGLLAEAKLAAEGDLVAGELAVQEPGAGAEAQDGVALATHPDVVVGLRAGAHGGLEQHVRVRPARRRDRDDGRLARRREREEPRVQEVAELPGVRGREGRQREGVAGGLYRGGLLLFVLFIV